MAAATAAPPAAAPTPYSRAAILHSVLFCLAQLVQEVISEQLFDGKINGPNSMASLALLYSFSQQFCCTLLSFALIQYQDYRPAGSKKPPPQQHHPPAWSVVLILAGLVAVSSSFANWSVEFVFYPAKVVMKSTKLVPVMMLSPLLGNSQAYTAVDYVSALCLSVGAAGFALSNGKDGSGSGGGVQDMGHGAGLAWIGLVLLAMAALCDAVIPNLQQRTMRRGARPEEMALRVNLLSSGAIFASLVSAGSIAPWLVLWQTNRDSLWLMVSGGLTFSVAVLSYTFLIVEAGSVAAVGVATVRKVVTLALSYLIFPDKTLTASHASSLLVFALGLALKPVWERTVQQRSSGKKKMTKEVSVV